IVKPIDKKFSTKKKEIKKFVLSQEYEIPEPEPIYRVTEKPYFLREGELIYPEDMKRLGKTAIVVVDALIDRKGKVRKTTIYKSAGKSFNDAAINAIKGSLFVPGKIAGKPVAVLYRLSMKFNLL
ncbi:MAG: energy transducer TonB, partial [Thiohalomonadales bacterium]